MINTNINGYLQYERIEQLNIPQSKANNTATEAETELNSNESATVNISEQSKAMLKIENLKTQLAEIFGVKKDLTSDELEKEKELQVSIEKINEKAELPYSESDLNSIKKINIEIEQILNRGYYKFEDDEQIFNLTKEISDISRKYGPPKLSENDKEQSETLSKELRELQGYKNPDVTELIKAEKIFTKIDIIKAELKLSELSISSNSYSTDRKKLEEEISTSTEKLNKLDTSKVEYDKEEIRENAKNLIKQSLSNISSIKNGFYNGEDYFSNKANTGYSNSVTTEQKENKWLDFLQNSRKEFYSGASVLDSKEQENYKLQKLIDRVNELHG